MHSGRICRFEEITRCPVEVQDVLVGVLSERAMLIPELGEEAGLLLAVEGFNVIATANTRDRGVNEMSSALRRRFNFETVRPIGDLTEECELVGQEVARQLGALGAAAEFPQDVLEMLVTTFHELRAGRDSEGVAVPATASPVSTAEAVAVGLQAALQAQHFGSGQVEPADVVRHLPGSLDADAEADGNALRSYFDVTVRRRAKEGTGPWPAYFAARELLD
jgi:MoxR-like ATPase